MGGRVILCVVLLALSACTRRNEGYCCTAADLCEDVGGVEQDCPSGQLCDDDGTLGPGPAHTCIPDPNVQVCEGNPDICVPPTPECIDGICVECDDDLDCEDAAEPRCDTGLNRCGDCAGAADCERFDPLLVCGPAGGCVECEPSDPPTESAACGAPASVCGADGMCRGCEDHRECASGACDLAAGACVDTDDVAYVDANADGGNTACTDTAPCRTIALGLAANRPYVVLDGDSYMEDVAISNRDVTLIGYDADLRAQTNGVDALIIGGTTGDVGAFGLTLHMSQRGLSCVGGTTTSTASVTLVDALVQDNTSRGIRALDCDLTMDSTRVIANPGGGLEINAAGFDITNSVFFDNGNNGTFGAIDIDDPRPGSPRRLAFNTIVGNRSGAVGFPGVACVSSTTLPTFHSNIISDNTGSTGGVQVSATNCSYQDSLINPAFDGDGNVTGDPGLDGTFHIAAGSPAHDAGRANGGVAVDFEGDLRDDAPDIGADELAP
jgi:hypothetical protein